MALSDTVAANLRHLRASQLISQTTLAERAGLSVSYVSMLERGQRCPPLETVDVLAKALQVPALRLFESVRGQSRPTDMRRVAARRGRR